MAKEKISVQAIILDKIISYCDSEIAKAKADKDYQPKILWNRPWIGGAENAPKSLSTKQTYNGLNIFILSATQEMMGYASNYWLTFKQAGKLGGRVKKGEHGTPISFWKYIDIKDKDTNEVTYRKWLLRYYRVFNLDQTEDIDPKKLPKDIVPEDKENPLINFTPIEICEKIVANMPKKPKYQETNKRRAYYVPSTDVVHMPLREVFLTEEEFYSTQFHELAHSTGHMDRLNRPGIAKFDFKGTDKYAEEELISEMTATIICGMAGIENKTIENSLAYIEGWRRQFKNDMSVIFRSATAAKKASEFILEGIKE